MRARYEIQDFENGCRVVAESYSIGLISQTFRRRFARFGKRYQIIDTFKLKTADGNS